MVKDNKVENIETVDNVKNDKNIKDINKVENVETVVEKVIVKKENNNEKYKSEKVTLTKIKVLSNWNHNGVKMNAGTVHEVTSDVVTIGLEHNLCEIIK